MERIEQLMAKAKECHDMASVIGQSNSGYSNLLNSIYLANRQEAERLAMLLEVNCV